ncbi:hypothetical protein MMC22_008830 [Lobaria immixta]|nr:hypothetical protein [Lobaria immixta]
MAILGRLLAEEPELFVDFGGSFGTVAISIVNRFPHLECVIQDEPPIVTEGKSKLPVELSSSVIFMAHDFFTEQLVVADLYYFRSIFHDWPEKFCIRILRNLIPALQPGARVLINGFIVPEPNTTSLYEEKRVR